MRILFVGDVFGSTGRDALARLLPLVMEKYRPDFTLVNGENAAGGRGITYEIAKSFFDMGVDGITMGNHTWDNKEIFEFIDSEKRLIRPANYPPGTPGRGSMLLRKNGLTLGVLNLQGRTFLPPLNCPFRTGEEEVKRLKEETPAVFVDFHAEASSEKMALAWHLDGSVAAVVGTHTHVQTNDARLLPQGTAYLTDVGMTGPYDGIIGVKRDAVMKKFLTQLPVRFEPAGGRWQFNACLVDVDPGTGKATAIRTLRVDEDTPFMG